MALSHRYDFRTQGTKNFLNTTVHLHAVLHAARCMNSNAFPGKDVTETFRDQLHRISKPADQVFRAFPVIRFIAKYLRVVTNRDAATRR